MDVFTPSPGRSLSYPERAGITPSPGRGLLLQGGAHAKQLAT
jgi:hypothetical protein